jgi:hypothetical protein
MLSCTIILYRRFLIIFSCSFSLVGVLFRSCRRSAQRSLSRWHIDLSTVCFLFGEWYSYSTIIVVCILRPLIDHHGAMGENSCASAGKKDRCSVSVTFVNRKRARRALKQCPHIAVYHVRGKRRFLCLTFTASNI